MRPFHCIIAGTEREKTDAQRVRRKVYVEEEALLPASVGVDGREIDALDDREGTLHFIVYEGQEAVGTVRLLQSSAEVERTESGRLGLDLESKFDLGALCAPGIVPAEVTRYCVLRRYRSTGVTTALFSGLYAESARRGITHWVAGANMQTDFAEDADLAYRIAQLEELMNEQLRAEPRAHDLPETPRRRPYYTEEQRRCARNGEIAGLDLPRTLALFAARMGARFIGPPVYDAYFNVFALPLVATLADIAASRASARGLHKQEGARVAVPA